jgi:hypothetical protein
MPATATARSSPRSARAPKGRRAPGARARGRTPPRGIAAPAHLIPVAVGRTAVAVGDFADSSLVVRITRSRLWIGILAGLLAGIVALNVLSLSLTASTGKLATRSDALARENALVRSRIGERLSSDRVESAAASLGLAVPEPGAIEYLSAGDAYAEVAAKRIERGDLTISSATPTAAPVTTETAVPPTPTASTAAAPTTPLP